MNTSTMQIMSIFKNVLLHTETKIFLLGRWQIEKCSKKLNIKIKLSNEDHCGACSQYETIKNKLNKKYI